MLQNNLTYIACKMFKMDDLGKIDVYNLTYILFIEFYELWIV